MEGKRSVEVMQEVASICDDAEKGSKDRCDDGSEYSLVNPFVKLSRYRFSMYRRTLHIYT